MIFSIAVLFLAVLGYIDYVTNPDLSFLIFYYIPILLCSWYISLRAGMLIAAVSAIIWVAADAYSRVPYFHWMVPYWNLAEKIVMFIAVSYLFGRLKMAFDRERQFAHTDSLTQIPNRRAFIKAAEREIERARRYGHPLSVAFVDIDDFKMVNDRGGHEKGDELLLLTAKTLVNHVRSIDVVARLGGDEFGLLLPQITSKQSRVALDKLRQFLLEGVRAHAFSVTFSIGVVTFRTPPKSVNDLLRQADHLMYGVKRTGKNNIASEDASDTLSAVV